MKAHSILAALCAAVLFAGCASQNKYEHEADKLTHAVMNNDLGPVKNDISPGVNITRVKVAVWSDELNSQGKLVSIKEQPTCFAGPGWHCFNVKFEKNAYVEWLSMDDQGKVTGWNFHIAPRT